MRRINVQTVAPQAFKCILELSLVKIYATFITAFKLAKSDAVSENSTDGKLQIQITVTYKVV